MLLRLMTAFIALVVAALGATRGYGWGVTYDTMSQRILVDVKGADGTTALRQIALPADTVDVAWDDRTIFVLRPKVHQIMLIARAELEAAAGEQDIIARGNLDLTPAVPKGLAEHMAVCRLGQVSLLALTSSKGDGRDEATLQIFALFNQDVPEMVPPRAEEGSSASGTQPPDPPSHVLALRGEAVSILGRDGIACVKNPRTLAPSIFALNSPRRTLARYDLDDVFQPRLTRTYDLRMHLPPTLDPSVRLGVRPRFDDLGEIAVSAQGTQYVLSAVELEARLATLRSDLLVRAVNDTIGNSWAKGFAALGALGSVVDFLDDQVGNPSLDFEDFAEHPDLKLLAKGSSVQETLEFAQSLGIFEKADLDKMRAEGQVRGSRGRRWFVIASIFSGALAYSRVRNWAGSREALRSFEANLRQVAMQTLAKVGLTNNRIKSMVEALSTAQRRFRGYLIRGLERERHQDYLLKQLKGRLVAAERKVTGFAATNIRSLPANARQSDLASAILADISELQRLESSSTLARAFAGDAHKVRVFERSLALQDELIRIKARMLNMIHRRQGADTRGITTAPDSLEFLQVTDQATIFAKRDEALAAVKAGWNNLTPKLQQEYQHILTQQLPKALEEFSALKGEIASWTTVGKVHPFFDVWAHVSALNSRYFIPESWFKRVPGLRSDFVARYVRFDRITQADGEIAAVTVTGADARLALTTGMADVSLDVVCQWLARQSLADPNERIWGTGDNFLEFYPGSDGKSYGIHFDLLGIEAVNLWGWVMQMPTSYARMGMGRGSKGQISYLQRLWDEQKKLPANMLYNTVTSAVPWWATKTLVLDDYDRDHADALQSGDTSVRAAAEEARRHFVKSLYGRTTETASFFERITFDKAVGIAYIKPQYWIQSEFNTIAGPLFRSGLPQKGIGALVMPITTGYYYHRWWGEYFAFHNPALLRVMRDLKIEGVLEKIDAEGKPDLARWTEDEKVTFATMSTLLEMDRRQKEDPMPEDPAQRESWHARVLDSLSNPESPHRLEDLRDSAGEFVYADSAERLHKAIQNLRRSVALFPLTEAPAHLAVRTVPADRATLEEDSERMEATLARLNSIQRLMGQALGELRVNRNSTSIYHNTSWGISLMDAIILGDSFFAGGKVPQLVASLAGRWRLLSESALRKLGTVFLVGQVPMFGWANDQGESHVAQGQTLGQLLFELQELLLETSETLTREWVNNSFAQSEPTRFDASMTAYIDNVRTLREQVRSLLFESKVSVDAMMHKRSYRWSGVLASYAPLGVGAGLGWMGTRHALFRASRGIITKMTDAAAKRMVQGSILLWIFAGQAAHNIGQQLELNVHDFLTLYQIYLGTTLELRYIETVHRYALSGNSDKMIDRQSILASIMREDEVAQDAEVFRERLVVLTQGEGG